MIAAAAGCAGAIAVILWIVAALLVIGGIVRLVTGDFLAGLAFIVIGCLVGPGGVSLFC